MNTLDRSLSNVLSILGELDPAKSTTALEFADGRIVHLPTALLENTALASAAVQESTAPADSIVLPLIEEHLDVSKRTVVTGKVRLEKTVGTYDIALDESLAVNGWKVGRVALHQVVETAPAIRREGTATIYPLVEERLVLTKELVLVEEIRVSPESSVRQDTQTVTLRREYIDVEREPVIAK